MRSLPIALLIAALGIACGPTTRGRDTTPGREHTDTGQGGLYTDFLDGKFDAAGHPVGAIFFDSTSCEWDTGITLGEGRQGDPGFDAPGTLCAGSADLGPGAWVVNARILLGDRRCEAEACNEVVGRIRVEDDAGERIDEVEITRERFLEGWRYEDVALRLRRYGSGAVRVSFVWNEAASIRLKYLEVFRSSPRVVVSPGSGLLDPLATLEIEVTETPAGMTLALSCDEIDLTDQWRALERSGVVTRTDTEFRTVFRSMLEPVITGCALPVHLRVEMQVDLRTREASRVTWWDVLEAPCTFLPDTTRVLFTGFEPFPAESNYPNASQALVDGFVLHRSDASVMRLILPVEWEMAPARVVETVRRCAPDLVVSFGQGRYRVDVETTAWNLRDTSAVSGGLPDNRGIVRGPEAIVPDGPDSLPTRLPVEGILGRLEAGGVDVATSDDPGRYLCNETFYTVVNDLERQPEVTAGFVHLPILRDIDPAAQAMLQSVAEAVIDAAVDG